MGRTIVSFHRIVALRRTVTCPPWHSQSLIRPAACLKAVLKSQVLSFQSPALVFPAGQRHRLKVQKLRITAKSTLKFAD